jgi:pyruvate dehydrogenase E2 component (dihydrolipoamide acetyltransferase)
VDGTLLAVFYHEDDDVPVLLNVAVIGAPGESYAEFAPDGAASATTEPAAEAPQSAGEPAKAAPAAQATAAAQKGFRRAQKRRPRRFGVNAGGRPTGPHGRVIERDVVTLAKDSRTGSGLGGRTTAADAAVAAAPAAPSATETPAAPASVEYDEVKMPNMRRMIAKTMHESLAQMAQLTHNTSFDATQVLAFRAHLKSAPEGMELPKITLNDIVLFAASRVLMKHEALNAHCLGDTMRYFKHVHLGIAVDTPRGLLVPTLFNADTKSLKQSRPNPSNSSRPRRTARSIRTCCRAERLRSATWASTASRASRR